MNSDLQAPPIGRRINSHRGDGYSEGVVTDFPVTYQRVQAGIFHVYVFKAIESPEQFVSAIEALMAAGENDTVVIHLSCPGGSLDATDTFLQAMDNCEGRVLVQASGGCHSAASIILMHAPEFTLSDNFNCLIHNGSFGLGGKYSDAVAQSRHTQAYMERILRDSYEGFLSPSEIDALMDGKDYWLNAEEFSKRYEARNAYMLAKMEESQSQVEYQALEMEKPVLLEVGKPKRKRK